MCFVCPPTILRRTSHGESLWSHPKETHSKDTSERCNNSPLQATILLRSLDSPRSSWLRLQTQAVGRGKHLPTSILDVPKGPREELLQPGSQPPSCFCWELEEKQPEVGWHSLPPGDGAALLLRRRTWGLETSFTSPVRFSFLHDSHGSCGRRWGGDGIPRSLGTRGEGRAVF